MSIRKGKESVDIRSLKGLTIVSRKEGVIEGNLSDIFIDIKTKKIKSIIFNNSFWKNNEKEIEAKNIEIIGNDAIIISSINDIKAKKQFNEAETISVQKIKNLGVVSQDGQYLGRLKDIKFSLKTWKIAELIISNYKTLVVDPNKIIMGVDDIMIPSQYVSKVKEHTKAEVFTSMFKNDLDFSIKQSDEVLAKQEKNIPMENTKNKEYTSSPPQT